MQKWFVRTNPTKYPDLFTYDILEPNPDAGKSGVVFSGENLAVAMGLDSKENAHLIAASPDMYEALLLVRGLLTTYPEWKLPNMTQETFNKVIEAINKAEGKGWE